MTAETDIAAIDDSGANTAGEVRTALTSVLERADSAIGCSLTKSSDQTVPTATHTAITFDGEDYDDGGMHNNSTNTSRITIPTGEGGVYVFTGSAEIEQLDDGKHILVYFRKNGTTALDGRGRYWAGSNNVYPSPTFSKIVKLSAGDYVELMVEHSQGSDLSVRASADGTSFTCEKLRAA